MSYINENGLSIPTQAEIAATAKARLISKLNGILRDDPDGVSYRLLVSMLSEAKSETLASMQAAVSALLPEKSVGEYLTELMRFNGITRNESEYTTVTLEITANTGGMNEAAGVAIAATPSGDEYLVLDPIVLGPSATGTFDARSVEKGAFVADAGEITEIATPLYGWASVTNPVAATPGRATETDPAARRRRWRAARGVGLHHESAIRRQLEDIDGVEVAVVSRTEPGVIECVVWGGDSQDIADTLFGVGTAADPMGAGSAAAGIDTTGTTQVAVADTDTGQSGTINYTIGSDIPIYIDVITTKIDGYPSGGDESIREAMVAFFEGNLTIEVGGVETVVEPFEPGENVVSSRLYTAANTVDYHSISAINIGLGPSVPTSDADIILNTRQRAVTSIAVVTVNGV